MVDPNTGEVLQGTDSSTIDGRHFKKKPAINVISKEEFEERIEEVFDILWNTLSKSFGPYGAPTIIYNHPFQHVTKDGYTIMKNTSMDASETLVDEAIKTMAEDICGRLNYAVGDGTTTAVIATNSIYKHYRMIREALNSNFILPRDIINHYDTIKNEIVERLQDKVRPIQSSNLDELADNIRDVVYISSNGDETITNIITNLYRELGKPAISCVAADDGITKERLIEGYQYDALLIERLYINNDDDTAKYTEADVIVIGRKVNKDIWTKIIHPLSEGSRIRGRHLIVAAPVYDSKVMQQVIAPMLRKEYREKGDINTVLTVYRNISDHTRKCANDFATLMGTTILDAAKCDEIIDLVNSGTPVEALFNIDGRNIVGARCCVGNGEDYGTIVYGKDEMPEGYKLLNELMSEPEVTIPLGYTRNCTLGLKESIFTDLVYNKDEYEAILSDAKKDLDEKIAKYEKLGTFNIEVNQAQERYYSLNLKMGVIEVGADSDLSQRLLKDAVDDAVRAAASAYKHGVVLGCNVSLLQVILDMYRESTPETVRSILIRILLEGFMDVYRTVLRNAFNPTQQWTSSDEAKNEDGLWDESAVDLFVEDVKRHIAEVMLPVAGDISNIFMDRDAFTMAIKNCLVLFNYVSVHDVIIMYSMLTGQVLDLSIWRYSNEVINSVQTDSEVLKATTDLITLIIAGNQMVVTQKHNF